MWVKRRDTEETFTGRNTTVENTPEGGKSWRKSVVFFYMKRKSSCKKCQAPHRSEGYGVQRAPRWLKNKFVEIIFQ